MNDYKFCAVIGWVLVANARCVHTLRTSIKGIQWVLSRAYLIMYFSTWLSLPMIFWMHNFFDFFLCVNQRCTWTKTHHMHFNVCLQSCCFLFDRNWIWIFYICSGEADLIISKWYLLFDARKRILDSYTNIKILLIFQFNDASRSCHHSPNSNLIAVI